MEILTVSVHVNVWRRSQILSGQKRVRSGVLKTLPDMELATNPVTIRSSFGATSSRKFRIKIGDSLISVGFTALGNSLTHQFLSRIRKRQVLEKFRFANINTFN